MREKRKPCNPATLLRAKKLEKWAVGENGIGLILLGVRGIVQWWCGVWGWCGDGVVIGDGFVGLLKKCEGGCV